MEVGGADKGGDSWEGGGYTELVLAVKMGTNDCQGKTVYGCCDCVDPFVEFVAKNTLAITLLSILKQNASSVLFELIRMHKKYFRINIIE